MLAQQNILALLHTFETAALHMSFTKAATTLSLTQGAVSQRIRSLESMLGFRLFIRMTRKLQLKGSVYLACSRFHLNVSVMK